MSITDVLSLGPAWVILPKIDGAYARVHLDGRGRIERLLSRTGGEFRGEVVRDLLGIKVGAPGAVLVGELEWGSEAAINAAERRGWRNVHLFDCIRTEGGRYLGREGYGTRRDELFRMVSEIAERANLSTTPDRRGRMHSRKNGRFVKAPRDFRRCPVVPRLIGGDVEAHWQKCGVVDGYEGLVACNLEAPIGRRRAKLKCKPISTIDAVVLEVDANGKRATVRWFGGSFRVGCKGAGIRVGQVVEVRFEGFYTSGEPRFARIVRERLDKVAA